MDHLPEGRPHFPSSFPLPLRPKAQVTIAVGCGNTGDGQGLFFLNPYLAMLKKCKPFTDIVMALRVGWLGLQGRMSRGRKPLGGEERELQRV